MPSNALSEISSTAVSANQDQQAAVPDVVENTSVEELRETVTMLRSTISNMLEQRKALSVEIDDLGDVLETKMREADTCYGKVKSL